MPAVIKRKPIYVLILPRFEDIFHSFYTGEITKGVNLAASRLNVDFLVHITDRSDHATWLDATLLDRKHVDGILFADIDNDLDIVKRAIMRGMPCLVLNNIIQEPINYIAVNNYKAAVQVVDEFVKLGHNRIATIAGDLSTQAGQSRLDGYRDALEKHNIPVDKGYIRTGGFLRTPARQAAQDLLKLKDRPTAIFAASDVMALEALDVERVSYSAGISKLEQSRQMSIWPCCVRMRRRKSRYLALFQMRLKSSLKMLPMIHLALGSRQHGTTLPSQVIMVE